MAAMSINDLAPEILCQIFDLSLNRGANMVNYYRSRRTAIALSHTCSYWRKLSTSYPALWTYISVFSMSTEIRQMFVQRSGSSLLTLLFVGEGPQHIEVPYRSHGPPPDYSPEVNLREGEYYELAQRARLIHVEGVAAYKLHIPQDLPNLEELIIKTYCTDTRKIGKVSAPNLRKLDLEGYSIAPATTPPSLLTELRLGDSAVNYRFLVYLLSTLPNLTVLFLTATHLYNFHPDTFIPLSAVRQVTLKLHSDDLRNFLSAVMMSLADRSGLKLSITPRWSGYRTSKTKELIDSIPADVFPLPLTRGAQTMVFFSYDPDSDMVGLTINNYIEDTDHHSPVHSKFLLFLGSAHHWSTPAMIELLDVLLLHPDTGTNNQVTLLSLPGEILSLAGSCLPREMLASRFPRLHHFSYTYKRGKDMAAVAEVLLQLAPATSHDHAADPVTVAIAQQNHSAQSSSGCSQRTLGFERLNVIYLDVVPEHLPALLANEAAMRLLSGMYVVFSRCRIVVASEEELESMFRTEAVRTFGVTVHLDHCTVRIGDSKEWVGIAMSGPRPASMSAIGR